MKNNYTYNKINILITGGAGYIGSHVAKQLLETTDYDIIILDNLSTGNKKTIDTLKMIREFRFVALDLKEFDRVNELIASTNIDVVMHFAASIVVPESVVDPLKYYLNNTVNTTNLIKCTVDNRVKKFIFSSTAAVYGEPQCISIDGIDETYPKNPINPYGTSKLMSEKILQDAAMSHESLKFVIFRYFNVAGADMQSRIGQSFPNATHLIKIASECATHKRDKMFLFGEDYETSDGTCVRDYIHVDDLASAHVLAINYLEENPSDIFNVGYGRGYSVKEVVETMKAVTEQDFEVETTARRAGDPASLIANNFKLISKMKWKPKYNDLNLICQSAYNWERCIS